MCCHCCCVVVIVIVYFNDYSKWVNNYFYENQPVDSNFLIFHFIIWKVFFCFGLFLVWSTFELKQGNEQFCFYYPRIFLSLTLFLFRFFFWKWQTSVHNIHHKNGFTFLKKKKKRNVFDQKPFLFQFKIHKLYVSSFSVATMNLYANVNTMAKISWLFSILQVLNQSLRFSPFLVLLSPKLNEIEPLQPTKKKTYLKSFIYQQFY